MKSILIQGLLFTSLVAPGIQGHTEETMTLDGSTIVGNRELPKALNIVPWKAAEIGDLAGRPMNSLLDEVLAPVDRDVFLRELEYYEVVHSSNRLDQ
jgi:hypothetical protein